MLMGMEGEAMLSPAIAQRDPFEYADAYCLYCRTGQEHKVIAELRCLENARILFAQRSKTERRDGRWMQVRKPLLPGYVFIYANSRVEVSVVYRFSNAFKLLRYDDGQSALRNNDRAFADWLWRHDGLIGLSKAVKIGERVQIVEGPLKDMGGTIMALDAHKKIAKVQLNIVGSTQWLWLSFDYIK